MVNEKKLNSILQKIHESGYDGMLLYDIKNIQYVSNYKPTSIAFCILKENPVIFTSKMDMENAKNTSEITLKEYESITQVIKSIKSEDGKNSTKNDITSSLLIEGSLAFNIYDKFKQDFKIKQSDILEKERMIKTKEEIDRIKTACDISHKALLDLDILKKQEEGFSELMASYELGRLIRENGGSEESFNTIIATGKKTSLPHSSPSKENMKQPILVDWGCKYMDYCSDTSRTYTYTEKEAEIEAIVLEAYNTAIKSVKPGKKLCEIDKVARDIITDYGYGNNFIHSTGHGLGLDIHEKPNVSKNDQTILEKDMIITIEPGIYLEGKFGIRIEDTVHVQNKGKVLGKLKPILN
ncbi:MAG: aminopeptidase P family protein [Methanobrevibacter sp.]|jgi:Xaa-Pro dipeptidase|nr:aminopeptidase P family protein [Methanobrevibacter sp.]